MAMSVCGEIDIFTKGEALTVEAVCTDGTPILRIGGGRYPGCVTMRVFTDDPKEMVTLGQAIIDEARSLMAGQIIDKEADYDATSELASSTI